MNLFKRWELVALFTVAIVMSVPQVTFACGVGDFCIPPSPAPTANNVSVSTTENTPVSISLQGTPFFSGDALAFATSTDPGEGVLGTIGSDGTVQYTPTNGYSGSDSFTYTATENGVVSTTTATVSITITAPVVTAPTVTAQAVSASTNEDQSVTIQLAGSSSDGSTTFTFATTSSPTSGTLSAIDQYNQVTYTPGSNFTGNDSFQYTASEATSSQTYTSSPQTVSISISTPATSTTPAAVPITLEVYTSDATVFDGPITVSACSETPGSSTFTVNGLCAVEQAAASNGFNMGWLWFSNGAAVVSVNGEGNWDNGPWYTTFDNGQALSVALNEQTLSPGDDLIVSDGPMPLELSVSTTSPEVNATTTATVLGFNANNFDYETVSGATINGAGVTTGVSGTVDITATSTDPFTISASASGFLTSTSTTITPFAASSNQNNSGGGGGGGGGGISISHGTFNLPAALSYLASEQKADGSFDDNSTYTDWGAIAFAAGNAATPLAKIKTYELTDQPTLSSATDYERHAMALEALGINPYSGTSVNYIAPILADFDGTQIGSASEDNDDIFGVLALTHAGYTSSDSIIQKEAAFILSKQQPDGSWDESPDLTGAAIEALGPLFNITGVNQALGEAAGYLLGSQLSTGGWSQNGSPTGTLSVDSTSWVQTAINGIIAENTPGFTSESAFASSGGYYPTDALASAQQQDGAVQPASQPVDTRVWSTSYAVVAASNEDWDAILQTFNQPGSSTSNGAGGGLSSTSTTTSATSTIATATSTSATSTPATPTATSTTSVATTTPVALAPLIASTPHFVKTANVSGPKTPLSSLTSTTTTVASATPTASSAAQTAAAAASGSVFPMKLLWIVLGLLVAGFLCWRAYSLFFAGSAS